LYAKTNAETYTKMQLATTLPAKQAEALGSGARCMEKYSRLEENSLAYVIISRFKGFLV